MGQHDSSKTRVRPVFNALLDAAPDGADWLLPLCSMASNRKNRIVQDAGRLKPIPSTSRMGEVFEREVPPPTRFLEWLLEHPDRMSCDDDSHSVHGTHSRSSGGASCSQATTLNERRRHIDFCFVPQQWAKNINHVEVLDGEPWWGLSDHRPLVVDIEL